MKAILFLPKSPAQLIDIDEDMQEYTYVGEQKSYELGLSPYIEMHHLTGDTCCCALFHEEARLRAMKYTGTFSLVRIGPVKLYGPVVIVGVHKENFCDVPTEVVQKYLK